MAVLKLLALMGAHFGIISAFEVVGPFQPSQGNVLGQVDILDEVHIEMDIVVHSWPSDDFASIIHATGTGGSCCNPGDRMPGLWLHKTKSANNGIYISFDNDYVGNWRTWATTAFAIGQVYHWEMDVTQNWMTVHVDGDLKYNDVNPTHPTFEGADLYGSDPWLEAADVTISNLTFTSQQSLPEVNAVEITTLDGAVDRNTATISNLGADVVKLDNAMAKLEEKVDKLVHTMEGLGDVIDQRMNSAVYYASSVGGNYDGFQAAPVEGDAMSIVLTAKDLAIVGLAAVTLMTTVCIVVSCKRSPGKGRYGVVSMGSCSD